MNHKFANHVPTLLAAAAAAFLLTSFSTPAIAALCDGISDVSDVDGTGVSDFDGSLDTVRMATGIVNPTFMTAPPGDTHRLFVLLQDGTIRIIKDGNLLANPFLDISALTTSPGDGGGDEEGLLGMAFHPNYATNGFFYIYHTDTTGANNMVARYKVDSADPDMADSSTRVVIITFAHPTNNNHNGGMIAFAPDDGYLYIGTGDGGGACDLPGNSQNVASNLGKILRIAPSTATPATPPYTNPSDNPYVGITGNDEIWSIGARNPWRFSFDRANSNLYIGDVGQNNWEEIDCRLASAPGKENYGWRNYEGAHCGPNPSCGGGPASCTVSNYVGPIAEYCHPATACGSYTGASITGGYVYRGCRMGDLAGTYVYGDYIANWVRTFRVDGTCSAIPFGQINNRTSDLSPSGGGLLNSITSFGEDAQGEIYIARRSGDVYKLLPTLRIFELAARRAPQFLLNGPATLDAPGNWTWEDLHATSGHVISLYKVYRSTSGPTGPFLCVHQGTTSTWTGGDGAIPSPGSVFYYLVTARTGTEETRPGQRSDGPPRTVDTLSSCPP